MRLPPSAADCRTAQHKEPCLGFGLIQQTRGYATAVLSGGRPLPFRAARQVRFELAGFVIRLVDFSAMFPNWGDIWGAQQLEDFKTDTIKGDLWDLFHRLHQLASGLMGGRSDIILLYKMLQIARAAAQIQGIDLPRAIKEQMDRFWQTVCS